MGTRFAARVSQAPPLRLLFKQRGLPGKAVGGGQSRATADGAPVDHRYVQDMLTAFFPAKAL